MALRGIQEYIAQDANNIARVKDEGNIVSIEGNTMYILESPEHVQIYADNIIAFLVTKRVEYTILIWPLKALYK